MLQFFIPINFFLLKWRISECECIGVLRHMQQYFSYICDGTDVQVD